MSQGPAKKPVIIEDKWTSLLAAWKRISTNLSLSASGGTLKHPPSRDSTHFLSLVLMVRVRGPSTAFPLRRTWIEKHGPSLCPPNASARWVPTIAQTSRAALMNFDFLRVVILAFRERFARCSFLTLLSYALHRQRNPRFNFGFRPNFHRSGRNSIFGVVSGWPVTRVEFSGCNQDFPKIGRYRTTVEFLNARQKSSAFRVFNGVLLSRNRTSSQLGDDRELSEAGCKCFY